LKTTWIKDNCPECEEINWICLGECGNADLTMSDIDGYKCHSCGEITLFDEEFTRDLEGVDEDMPREEFIENYGNYEDGLEFPD